MKKCSRCKIEKELESFSKKNASKDKHGNMCLICVKEYNKLYFDNNKEKIRKKAILYYYENKDKILENHKSGYSKQYYLENKEDHNKRTKKWVESNKERKREIDKKWRKDNPERYKELTRKSAQKRYKEDIQYKLKNLLRARISHALKIQETNKKNSSISYLGCSIKEYKIYLESLFLIGMYWENYGKIWEIGHKIGICNFDLTKEKEIYKAFNYNNTQPEFSTTEIAKSFGYINEIGNRNKNKYEI